MSNTTVEPVAKYVVTWRSKHTGNVNETPFSSQQLADNYAASLRHWEHEVIGVEFFKAAPVTQEQEDILDGNVLPHQAPVPKLTKLSDEELYAAGRLSTRNPNEQHLSPAPEPVFDPIDITRPEPKQTNIERFARERYEAVKAIAILRKAAAHAGLKGAWKGPKRDELIAHLVDAEVRTGIDYLEATK